MAATAIEWTDKTWNPTRGCSRQSPGCKNCYAEREAWRIVRMNRGQGIPEGQGAYDGLVTMTSQGPKWTGLLREVPKKLAEPMTWRKPAKVFVNSMSDIFHPGVSIEFIADVFAHMAYAHWHTFQVLTKQAERMHQVLTSAEFHERFESATGIAIDTAYEIVGRRKGNPIVTGLAEIRDMDPRLPLPNVWLGVSGEDQEHAELRIELLQRTPAARRILSAEPLLAPLDVRPWLQGPRRVDQVIVGGESGPGARLMKGDWVRSLRDQCQAAGVAFFFKQWGGAAPEEAGRLLDGREWNEFPGACHG